MRWQILQDIICFFGASRYTDQIVPDEDGSTITCIDSVCGVENSSTLVIPGLAFMVFELMLG